MRPWRKQDCDETGFPGVTRWRLKSHDIEAMSWDGTVTSATAIINWALANGGTARYHDDPVALSINIPGGTVKALPGDWIVKCPDGTFRPLAERDFLDLHEPVGVLVSGDDAVRERIARHMEALAVGGRPSVMTQRLALLGQRVRVKLDEHIVQEGKLLGFDDGGEIQIEGDDGFVWHGWPALEVTLVTT